jgi:hypothetical protein
MEKIGCRQDGGECNGRIGDDDDDDDSDDIDDGDDDDGDGRGGGRGIESGECGGGRGSVAAQRRAIGVSSVRRGCHAAVHRACIRLPPRLLASHLASSPRSRLPRRRSRCVCRRARRCSLLHHSVHLSIFVVLFFGVCVLEKTLVADVKRFSCIECTAFTNNI